MTGNIRCLIVDDEKNAHYVLQNYIDRHQHLELAGQCYDALTAKNFIENYAVDLIFLDINMPLTNGFDLIKSLTLPAKIILTTAYSQFALEAYNYGVLDYLVKPIPYPRFEQAVQRYQETIPQKPEPLSLAVEQTSFLSLKTDKGIIDFPLEDICYLQSWGNYIKLYTLEETHLCTSTTVEAERKLPKEQFIRIHKSYIVAIDQIKEFQGDTVYLKSFDVTLPVGITYRRILSETLNVS